MYAVIRSGGKQYRVEEGDRLAVEHLGAAADSSVSLTPVLVVDGGRVLATPSELDGAAVSARIVDADARGRKITGFTYKSKSNQRRHWGHRQHQSVIEITGINAGGRGAQQADAGEVPSATGAAAPAKTPAKKAPAKKTPAAKKAPAKRAPVKKKGTS